MYQVWNIDIKCIVICFTVDLSSKIPLLQHSWAPLVVKVEGISICNSQNWSLWWTLSKLLLYRSNRKCVMIKIKNWSNRKCYLFFFLRSSFVDKPTQFQLGALAPSLLVECIVFLVLAAAAVYLVCYSYFAPLYLRVLADYLVWMWRSTCFYFSIS